MKGMKRKFFLKRMWNFVVVMLIPALLLVAWLMRRLCAGAGPGEDLGCLILRGLGRGPGGGVHFLGGGLVEILGQGFAGGSVDALQLDAAVGAALAADVVVAEELGHVDLR